MFFWSVKSVVSINNNLEKFELILHTILYTRIPTFEVAVYDKLVKTVKNGF